MSVCSTSPAMARTSTSRDSGSWSLHVRLWSWSCHCGVHQTSLSSWIWLVVAFSSPTGFFFCFLGGGACSTIQSPPLLFLFFFFFLFLKSRLARTHLFHFSGQDQSTVAQQAETTVAECSLASCVRARFLVSSHTTPGQQHNQPTPTLLDQGRMRV